MDESHKVKISLWVKTQHLLTDIEFKMRSLQLDILRKCSVRQMKVVLILSFPLKMLTWFNKTFGAKRPQKSS
jgi:hypothetical protein